MKRRIVVLLTVVLMVLATLVSSTPGFSQPPIPPGVEKLRQDAGGEVDITWDPESGNPSFIRGRIPLRPADLKEKADPATAVLTFLGRYGEVFELEDPKAELEVVESVTDELGMTHVTLRQEYQGVEVYNAQIKVHLSADSQAVVAISNGFVPDIRLLDTRPRVGADQALAAAQKALPKGTLLTDPKLVVYPGSGKAPGASARLAWLVELRDDLVPARNVYVVDATEGGILDVLDRLYEQGRGSDGSPARDPIATPVSNDQVLTKISPHIMTLTEGRAEAEFFLILTDQADLSYASELPTKAEKGRYVYQTLWDKARSTQAPLKAWLDSQGVKYQSFYIVNALLVKGDRKLVMAAATRQDVARIEANPKVRVIPDRSFVPDGPEVPAVLATSNAIEPNIRYVRAPGAWALGFTGQGVVVGGQDTGYDWDHPAIKTRYRGWDGSTASHDYNWHDSIHSGGGACGHDSSEPCDDGEHGTHTMGTVVGNDGGANQIGVAPDAKWIGCRNMDQGVGSPSTYLECLEFFLAPYPVGGTPAEGRPELAPDVTNNSWACPPEEGCSWDTLRTAIEGQRMAGIMTVVSAGNNGSSCSSVSEPPALYDAAYTVGALDTGTNNLASLSSRGPVTIDGSNHRKPDIAAPGTNIRSSVPGGGYEGGWQGTSMAGPHVAGAVALLWSAVPSLIGQIDLTENYLNNNAIHINSTECSSSGWPNNLYGYGRLDILAAVRDALSIQGGHRYRETYDANHGHSLPGTLVRSEGDGPTGDQDVDNAHDFAGETYGYYWNTHNRDSYDDQGETIVSTANYGQSYMNAFWNGEQVVYGDEFPVKDVVAHEWTHAVTEHSANLEYRWQSGALNESFSDVFGAMVDRTDWLMGEDLPPDVLAGREAIRDLADPPRLGQPGHTDDWVSSCSDNEGVHTNSGIPNKAFYNVATAIGKDKAEQIFYRTLTVYLDTGSSLEDARAAALQSAEDLYGSGSAEYNAVRDGFNAVGLDGQWNPPPNDCTCATMTALSDKTVYSDRLSALEVAATLYRVRDQLLNTRATGQHYRALYEQHAGRISHLLLLDSALRATGGQILKEFTPGLKQLVNGRGDESVVTQKMVTDVISFLRRLADEDRLRGGGELAQTIKREMARIDWDPLIGMTLEEAWAYINSRITVQPYTIYPPVVLE